MKAEKFKPPQPIPFPKNKIVKEIYRIPILLYRLGLGKIVGKAILIISTFGRKTGKVHRTPIEYYRHQGKLYVMSGFMDSPDWYQNLQANPHVTLNTDQGVMHAIARKPETEEEWRGAAGFFKNSPIAIIIAPGLVRKMDDPEFLEEIKDWPVLTFDRTVEPCPPALETDLLWAWPIILLALALRIMLGWLFHRKD
jgi:deazaflavin-dependent oxidoreductase (nitroreductase family)